MDGVEDLFARMRHAAAWLLLACVSFFVVRNIEAPTPPVAVSLANGTYKSKCCGDIVLNDGILRSGSLTVGYKLWVGKTDLSGETAVPLGVSPDHRVVLDARKKSLWLKFWRYPHESNMMNLYDTRLVPPNMLTLFSTQGSGRYDFEKVDSLISPSCGH